MPRYSPLQEEILRLKETRNAVLLAHNYQIPGIQDIADYVGDSLGLSSIAAKTDADIIVFCGVHFMAETAAIISPEKKVLIPDPEAGCSLAASINAEQLREWKREHPNAVVVSYVNTTAEVKAESDYCCTSTNAVEVVQAIPEDREILFLPDMFLGAYVSAKTGRKLHIWPGECHVHAGIRPEDIVAQRRAHPQAEMLIHPECGCVTSCMYLSADPENGLGEAYIYSTEGMVRHVQNSSSREFLIATEVGILHRMQKEAPDRTFLPVNPEAVCQYMKMITLDKVLRSLRHDVFEVRVPEDIARRARTAIERMLAIS